MKPLLAQKVARGSVVNEWEPAEHHLTHDGQNAFMARMLARIKAADDARNANSSEADRKVRTINRKERKA